MMESLSESRADGGICLLTLNRPDSLNAIDMALADRLSRTLCALATDDAVRCIVLTGAGRAFCAGFDINEMSAFDAAGMLSAFITRDPLLLQVACFPKPIIAALNGITYGAGALLAAACDMRVGCPATRFKVTAVGYGGANATWSLPRIVGPAKAKELLMTGRAVDAEEGLAIGLLNACADDAVATAMEIARMIVANPPAGVTGIKMLVDANEHRAIADAFRAEFTWLIENLRAAQKPGAEVFTSFLGSKR